MFAFGCSRLDARIWMFTFGCSRLDVRVCMFAFVGSHSLGLQIILVSRFTSPCNNSVSFCHGERTTGGRLPYVLLVIVVFANDSHLVRRDLPSRNRRRIDQSWKYLDVRIWTFESGCSRLDVRVWMFLFGCSHLDVCIWMFPFGCSHLDVHILIFAVGCSRLNVRIWMFAFGCSHLGRSVR